MLDWMWSIWESGTHRPLGRPGLAHSSRRGEHTLQVVLCVNVVTQHLKARTQHSQGVTNRSICQDLLGS